MSARILRSMPYTGMVAPKLETVYRWFLDALDAFAAAKMRKAVPEHELRRAQREINRYRRLLHAHQKLPVKTAPAGH
jgi:hypothetical protein